MTLRDRIKPVILAYAVHLSIAKLKGEKGEEDFNRAVESAVDDLMALFEAASLLTLENEAKKNPGS